MNEDADMAVLVRPLLDRAMPARPFEDMSEFRRRCCCSCVGGRPEAICFKYSPGEMPWDAGCDEPPVAWLLVEEEAATVVVDPEPDPIVVLARAASRLGPKLARAEAAALMVAAAVADEVLPPLPLPLPVPMFPSPAAAPRASNMDAILSAMA